MSLSDVSITNMKRVRVTYESPLRRAQAAATRERVLEAMSSLLGESDSAESITYRAVAERAGVTEMTVYRHFPTRQALLTGLWAWLNTRISPDVGMPASEAALTDQLEPLFEGFDRLPAQITASVLSSRGREMRETLDAERQRAFLAAVADAAEGLDDGTKRRAAAAIQLLHSAYAWLSMREQWGLSGKDAANTSAWVIRLILADLRKQSKRARPRRSR